MVASLSKRLREFTVHVERLALKEVPGRLAGYLIHLQDVYQVSNCQGARDGKQGQQDDVNPAEI